MRVYDFRCPQGHVNEALVYKHGDTIQCPNCGAVATHLPPGPRSRLEGITGSFPSAAASWERNRESHMKKERKYMDSHGEYLPGQKIVDAT